MKFAMRSCKFIASTTLLFHPNVPNTFFIVSGVEPLNTGVILLSISTTPPMSKMVQAIFTNSTIVPYIVNPDGILVTSRIKNGTIVAIRYALRRTTVQTLCQKNCSRTMSILIVGASSTIKNVATPSHPVIHCAGRIHSSRIFNNGITAMMTPKIIAVRIATTVHTLKAAA